MSEFDEEESESDDTEEELPPGAENSEMATIMAALKGIFLLFLKKGLRLQSSGPIR